MKLMVSGYPSGAQRGHHTMSGCVREWQKHCVLGVHAHPVDPQFVQSGPAKTQGRPTNPGPQEELQVLELWRLFMTADPGFRQQFGMPNLSQLSLANSAVEETLSESGVSITSASSLTATTWAAVPRGGRFFAIWGRGIVYSDRWVLLQTLRWLNLTKSSIWSLFIFPCKYCAVSGQRPGLHFCRWRRRRVNLESCQP